MDERITCPNVCRVIEVFGAKLPPCRLKGDPGVLSVPRMFMSERVPPFGFRPVQNSRKIHKFKQLAQLE